MGIMKDFFADYQRYAGIFKTNHPYYLMKMLIEEGKKLWKGSARLYEICGKEDGETGILIKIFY